MQSKKRKSRREQRKRARPVASLGQLPLARRLFIGQLVLFLGCCLLPSFCVQAQAQNVDESEAIRIDTELVDLNISIFSRKPGETVSELQQKDFAVLENGEPQEITFFASAATPFDLVLLIDLSGSIADKLDLVRKSAKRFVEAARPEDRIGIVTFTNTPKVVSPLTSDRAQLQTRIRKIERPGGGTNFWDALRFVLEDVLGQSQAAAQGNRKAIVLMTDGVDNALPGVPGEGSQTSFDELLDSVRRSDAIVLPIYLDTEAEEVRRHRTPPEAFVLAQQQLAQLAAESGSILYRARKAEDLKGVYEQVISDLGTVYSIGYRPSNRQRDGSWRAVTVELLGRPNLSARAKRGYFAR